METIEALKIIQNLANGIDPHTGEVFPLESPYQNVQTVRALFVATKALESAVRNEQRRSSLPDRAGEAWQTDEDQQLVAGFDKGASVDELAKVHQRTQGGIRSRLIKLGKIAE